MCGECDGSGRNGTLGGYKLLCYRCRGHGAIVRDVAGINVVIVIAPLDDDDDDPDGDG